MATRVFDREALNRYIENLEVAQRNRSARIAQQIGKLKHIERKVQELTGLIDERIAKVNQLRGRRHNIIGVSWRIQKSSLENSYSQPIGPVWTQQVHSRITGRRHLKRVDKITLALVKESCQGRDVGVLKRLYVEIAGLAKERNRLLKALNGVVNALRNV